MIKGLLKSLCTLGLILLPISFSSATFTAHSIGAFTPSVGDSSINLSVFTFGEVYSEQGSIEKFVFAPTSNLLFYWDLDSKPILLLPNCYSNRYGGELQYYYFCDEIPDSNFNGMTNCETFQFINEDYLASFMSSVSSSDNWAYEFKQGSNLLYGFNLCFSSRSEGKSLCFGSQSSTYNNWCYMQQSDLTCDDGYCHYNNPFVGSEYTDLTYTLDSIPIEEIGFSPSSEQNPNIPTTGSFNITGYVYDSITTGDYIDYFEKQKGFTDDLCYIGTKDLSSNYEDRITYYQGSGYTIFDIYSRLFGTNNFSLNNLGMYLNMIYANYRSWFLGYNRDSDGNVIYNMVYSGGAIELDYGPGLVNPFLNNKAYLYFIGSTALQSNIDNYTAGQDIALYCFYRLHNYSNDGSTYNITDDLDHSKYDNSVNYFRFQQRSTRTWSGADEIVGQAWDGTPLDYFSGYEENRSNFTEWFNANFNKMKVGWSDFNYGDIGLGYIPNYIIFFLIALILFRFISH